MKIPVKSHKLFARRDILRIAERLTPDAARLVAWAVPGRMPRVTVIVTHPKGLAELATAAEAALAGGVDAAAGMRAVADAYRHARKAAGRAVALPDGSVWVLLNARQLRTREDVARTLVHELTHAMQFSRPGIRDRMARDLRDAFGVAPQSRRAAREHTRRLRDEEREAYAAERLADRLTGPAALAA